MSSVHSEHLQVMRAALVERRRQLADPAVTTSALDATMDELTRLQLWVEVLDRAIADEAELTAVDFKSRRIVSMTSKPGVR